MAYRNTTVASDGSIEGPAKAWDGQHRSGSLQRSSHDPTRQFSAFSLLELLVVIAIIAVLAGMITPSLMMAKKLACNVVDMANRRGIVLFKDDFESYPNGQHPARWTEMTGSTANDLVTDQWGLKGTKSLVSTCRSGGWVNRAVMDLQEIGVWPGWPPMQAYYYDVFIHFEASRYSTGIMGFTFWDPRHPSTQVPITNGVYFADSGEVGWTGRTSVALRRWKPGTDCTFHVRVEVDPVSQLADVYITEVDDRCANALKSEAFRGLKAWPNVIPASSQYGREIPLRSWGFGMNNWWDGSSEPGRVFIDELSFGETSSK